MKKVASQIPGTPDPQVLAGRVLAELGIPPGAPPPIVARTFVTNLNAAGLDEVLEEK